MHSVCTFAVIFENCEFFGKSHQQHGGANLSSNLREETDNFNAGQSPRVHLVMGINGRITVFFRILSTVTIFFSLFLSGASTIAVRLLFRCGYYYDL